MNRKIIFILFALVFCITPVFADYTLGDLAAWMNRKVGYIDDANCGNKKVAIRLTDTTFTLIFFLERKTGASEDTICGVRFVTDDKYHCDEDCPKVIQNALEQDKIILSGLKIVKQFSYNCDVYDIGRTW